MSSKKIIKRIKKTIRQAGNALSKRSQLFKKIYRKAIFVTVRRRYNKYVKTYPLDEKAVLFQSFDGRQFACSPKAIYLEMKRQKLDYHYIWAFRDLEAHRYLEDEQTTLVEFGSKDYYKACAKSKFWISNWRIRRYVKPRDGQVYIQCWHGTPFKRIGCDIKVEGRNALNTQKELQDLYTQDAKRYTYLISPSRFYSEALTSAFKIEDTSIIKELGYPRNDYLFHYTDEDVKAVKAKLGIPEDKKVILYAPTWRENQHNSRIGYTYQLALDFGALREKIGDDYVILFRTHYFIDNMIDLSVYEGFVYNVSRYDDINDLYIISDALITDYSSVFFDYANLRRPMYFYMYDYEEYKNDMRDFYFDLKELPGPISLTQEELTRDLLADDYEEKYHDLYDKFIARFDYLDDGQASARVIELIKGHEKS